MKNAILIGFLAAMLILPISGYALGIASDYIENNVYKIEIGTTEAEYGFRLQNMEDSAVTVKVSLMSDIASIKDLADSYTLPPKSTETSLMIDIAIPSDAEIGDTYQVSYSVDEVAEGTGQVVVGKALTKTFTVQIVEEGQGTVIQQRETNSQPSMLIVYLIVIIAVIIAVAYFVSRKIK